MNESMFMNESIMMNVSTSVSQSLAKQSEGSSKLLEGILTVVDKIVSSVLDAATNHGWQEAVIIFLAIIGFFALMTSLFTNITGGLGILFKIFIMIPLIIILGFVNKKNRNGRREQLSKLRDEAKKQNKKITKWNWILFFIKIVIVPILIFLLFLTQVFL